MRKSVITQAGVVLFIGLLTNGMLAFGQDMPPAIDQAKLLWDSSRRSVTISYRLTDREEEPITIGLYLSKDSGQSYNPLVQGVSGDVGANVATGRRTIRWDYAGDKPDVRKFRWRLVADDGVNEPAAMYLAQVDSARLRRNLSSIAVVRDPVSPDGRKNLVGVKALIEGTMAKNGFTTERQPFTYGHYQGENIIGRMKGTTNPDEICLVVASFDGVANCPAANNNGSGVAGLLELAEILGHYRYKRSIVLVATDYTGEEFIGSNQFVYHGGIRDFEKVMGGIDLDRIGTFSNRVNSTPADEAKEKLFKANFDSVVADSARANFLKVVSNTESMPLANDFIRQARAVEPGLKIVVEEFPGHGELSVGNEDFLQFSDHIAFWYHRYKAIWITDAREGIKRDNSPLDTVDKIDFDFLGKAVRISLATVVDVAGIAHRTVVDLSIH